DPSTPEMTIRPKSHGSEEPPPMTMPGLAPSGRPLVGDDRTGMDDDSLRRAFLDHLSFSLGKNAGNATELDRFFSLALTVRDRLTHRWAQTQETYSRVDAKRIYYLSAE